MTDGYRFHTGSVGEVGRVQSFRSGSSCSVHVHYAFLGRHNPHHSSNQLIHEDRAECQRRASVRLCCQYDIYGQV